MDNQLKSALNPTLISVGMPVRNEARFLEAALNAMVSQAAANLEIIISDNASSDATESICRYYSGLYPFIRYHRFADNIGASANFRFVLEEAKGEFFMWASGHDVWDDNYLQACSAALVANPDVALAFGTPRWIDADGNPLSRSWGWSDTRGLGLVARYCTVFWGNMNPILGMIRTQELRQQKFDDLVGVDLAILLGLAMKGEFMHVFQTGWGRREFRHESSYQQKLERYRSADFSLGTSLLSRYFPLLRLPFRIIGDVLHASLPVWQKLQLVLILLVSLPVKYFSDKSRKYATTKKHVTEHPGRSTEDSAP